jgi:glycogen phosphorylase
MSTKSVMATKAAVPGDATQLLKQYGCGPIPLMGTDGFSRRHLLFDNMKGLLEISCRERYEAFARSL